MTYQKTKTRIPVQFEVEYEISPLKKFQSDGHFAPAMRARDAKGNLTMQPRAWKGALVHALNLFDAAGAQVCRSVADSREECERLLSAQTREQFFSSLRTIEIVSFNADQARRVKDERDRLVNWMIAHAPVNELAKALGIAEAAVAEYLAKEAALQADPTPVVNALRGAM